MHANAKSTGIYLLVSSANFPVIHDLQVGSIVNLSLMYLLAPTAATAAGKSMGFIERLFSDQILRSWGAPTGHMFERGYPFASRVVNLGYKVRSLMQYPIHVKGFLKL